MSSVSKLANDLGETWVNIERAASQAKTKLKHISDELQLCRLVPPDTAVVAFGSLARHEWTSGSDLDWTLLVDGAVNADHLDTTRQIRKHLGDLKYIPPGSSGLFGGLAFSHDIVHLIGGQRDTNRNTTQRILLLLESSNVSSNADVRQRVIKALLRRYVGEDLRYGASTSSIPMFLLNDIVRYWRTIAVDFAGKRQERDGGWAIRNAKLRLSRKLIYTAGLWMCLDCRLRPEVVDSLDDEEFLLKQTERLSDMVSRSPLDIVAEALLAYGADEAARLVFGAYDDFLSILDDPEKRGQLKSLTAEQANSDPVFGEARDAGRRFQEGLTRLFFTTDDELTKLTQRYGVF